MSFMQQCSGIFIYLINFIRITLFLFFIYVFVIICFVSILFFSNCDAKISNYVTFYKLLDKSDFLNVSGKSMFPELKDNSLIVCEKFPKQINVEDIVCFYVNYKNKNVNLVKKVKSIDVNNEEVFVVGNTKNSIDSKNFGKINCKNIYSKVLFSIALFKC